VESGGVRQSPPESNRIIWGREKDSAVDVDNVSEHVALALVLDLVLGRFGLGVGVASLSGSTLFKEEDECLNDLDCGGGAAICCGCCEQSGASYCP